MNIISLLINHMILYLMKHARNILRMDAGSRMKGITMRL